MKRSYMTPVIVVENFVATQVIMGCSIKINSMGTQCVLDDSDAGDEMKSWADFMGWFVDRPGCDEVAEGMEFDDGTCYHTSANTTFTS